MRVLEKARTAHGQRTVDHLEERHQVLLDPHWELGAEEGVEDIGVGGVAQSEGIEAVLGHELVEDVRAEHHRARDGYGESVEIVADGILLDDAVHECQAAAFAAETPLPYTGEIGVMVEAVLLEDGHHAAVLHLAVLDDEVEK